MIPTRARSLLIAPLLALAACGGGDAPDEAIDEGPAPDEEAAAAMEQMVPGIVPDTAADALWETLQTADYRANWELWPEKGELYSGGEPHGMLLTTYLNGVALQALRGGAGSLPLGSILVKENFMPDSTLAATTVMVKRPVPYNPQHRGWYFMKRLADGTVEAAGRVEGCQSCHAQAADNDYVLTGSLSGG